MDNVSETMMQRFFSLWALEAWTDHLKVAFNYEKSESDTVRQRNLTSYNSHDQDRQDTLFIHFPILKSAVVFLFFCKKKVLLYQCLFNEKLYSVIYLSNWSIFVPGSSTHCKYIKIMSLTEL